ncbi:MAG: RNA polymerase sigma factor [Breznakibacter sp.]
MIDIAEDKIIPLLKAERTRDEGFTLLMRKYQKRIYLHARRLLVSHENAEDAVQETFINAYRYLHKFNQESAIYTWLYRIATNECIRIMKKQKKIFDHSNQMELLFDHQVSDDWSMTADEMQKRFQKAILKLPEKQRIVFNLRYFDEMGYEQMSQVLDTSVGSLKTSYHYACEKIKETVSKQ